MGKCNGHDFATETTAVRIKRSAAETKFKLRCKRYLYTLRIQDSSKADKLKQSLPPGTLLYPPHL